MRRIILVTMLTIPFLMANAIDAAILFEDDFEDGVIDSTKWILGVTTGGGPTPLPGNVGHYVEETNGILRVVQGQTNWGGRASTVPTVIDPGMPISIKKRTRLHYANQYYGGDCSLKVLDSSGVNIQWLNSVAYYNYSYGGNNWFGFGNADHNVFLPPIWDEWFDEIIIYDPVTGEIEYSINNGDSIIIPGNPIDSNTLSVSLTSYGWWTGHYQELDYIRIEQSIIANNPPSANTGGPYIVNEGDSIQVSASGSDPDGDAIAFAWDLNDDGNFETSGQNVLFSATALDGPSTHNIAVQVTDSGGLSTVDQTTVEVHNVAPTLYGILDMPLDPIQLGTPTNPRANFSDPGMHDTHSATWNWGDGSMTSLEDVASPITIEHTYGSPGVYTVSLEVTDDDGGSPGEVIYQYVVVYDPEGGFVTGGGWINSPEGAYAIDPSLTGKATFGFMSRYKKGATLPTGNTHFNFRVADLDFQSTSYEWLVVAGPKAMFKGTGTINSAGNYGFMLSAIDGQVNGGGGIDKFRIKIWDKDSSDAIMYDNQMEAEENADPTTAIGGGSIVIHGDPKAAPELLPKETRLLNAYPNPFNPDVWIPYRLSSHSEVVIRIHDMTGRLVRTLDMGYQPAGIYVSKSKAAHWDGANESGERVASGIYFYTLKAGDFSATRKMVVRK